MGSRLERSFIESEGRWSEADGLRIQITDIKKTVFGEEQRDSLTSISKPASQLSYLGGWGDVEVAELRDSWT
jgi:hypothetical protein